MDVDDLQLGLSGDESVEEDRSDEIKRALTELDETFDDESDHSLFAEIGPPAKSSTRHSFERVNGKTNGFQNETEVKSSPLHSFANDDSREKRVRFQANPVVTVMNGRQADREDEEMEAKNATLSLLHEKHCPKKDTDFIRQFTNNSDSSIEKLQAVITMRDRRIQQLEEDIKSYSKEKRSLNHQIGLVKTEMIQLKTSNDELHKVVQLRDDELSYLKNKMTEALEEYDLVRKEKDAVNDEINSYKDLVTQLRQEVQMLSAIGDSSRNTELNDVIRQIRERHAKEIAAWQTSHADLESQLQIYKRNQHSLHNESIIVETEVKAVQTEDIIWPKPKTVRTSEFGQTVNILPETKTIRTSEFGQTANILPEMESNRSRMQELSNHKHTGDGDADRSFQPPPEVVNKTLLEKWREKMTMMEEEKNRLVDYYEKEMNEYKTKLAILPSELYAKWSKQQEDLGLLFGNAATRVKSPHQVDGFAQTEQLSHASTKDVADSAPAKKVSTVDRASSTADLGDHKDKDSSSVIIQTEETLETYNALGDVIHGWAKEVALSTQRADVAEKEIMLFTERYQNLEYNVKKLRKEWREKEKQLRQTIDDQKGKFLSILSRVSSKLEIIE